MGEKLDILPCGYIAFTENGLVRDCNQTLASWLKYSKQEVEGKSIENIFTLASRIFYNTHFFPLIKLQSQVSEIFVTLRDRENGDIPVLANANLVSNEIGSIIHCIFVRVEERKKYEQEILEAKREAENALKENKHLTDLSKSIEKHALELEKHYQHQMMTNENLIQFSKIISHDLQEPIRKIQVFIDQIVNDADNTLSSKSKVLSDKIDIAATKLKTLTISLQEYIAIDNEKNRTSVDLNAVIETAKSRAVRVRKFVDFDVDIETMPSIEGYEKQLELLFFHLIDNSIQFRDPSRRLNIKIGQLVLSENIFRVSKDQYRYTDHLRITFEDNGVGFSQEYSDYVFTLLKKVHESTGLGVGLPLVKKIVQNHAGSIRVISVPEKGTCFEIELPLKANG